MSVDEASECTICFEVIANDARCALPCECKIDYCMGCWDRALAAAFNSSGRAKCPTCRGAVRVDFDPEAADGRGKLVFSAADPSEGQISQTAVVNRLAGQAAPLMARLLRRHGEEHPFLRVIAHDPGAFLASRPARELRTLLQELGGDGAGCLEKGDFVERMLIYAKGAPKLAAFIAATDARSAGDETAADSSGNNNNCRRHARCVCGGRLERLSGRDRCRSATQKLFATMAQQLPPALHDAFMEQLGTRVSMVVCDLCDTQLTPQSAVYSCGTGEKTILHPTTYDVCEDCFVLFAIEGRGDEVLATQRRE